VRTHDESLYASGGSVFRNIKNAPMLARNRPAAERSVSSFVRIHLHICLALTRKSRLEESEYFVGGIKTSCEDCPLWAYRKRIATLCGRWIAGVTSALLATFERN
jgi:hypothetical protein